MTKITAWDAEILARTLYGEGRGERFEDMAQIGYCILNRVADPRWPETIALVCTQPLQFSCHNAKDPNRVRLMSVGLDDLAFRKCMAAAWACIASTVENRIGKANHYLTLSLARSDKAPSWAGKMRDTRACGAHLFGVL